MAYLPQFERDIFISYRHSSNEGPDRWVDRFYQGLQFKLKDMLGEIEMWRDEAGIRKGDQWHPEILKAINGAAIFIAVLSLTYFDSDVCAQELDEFLGRVKEADDTKQRRLVPVFKQPLPDDRLPPEIKARDPHKFFHQDPPPSGRFREFNPKQLDGPFWETLDQLAQDLRVALEELRGKARQRAAGRVYLGRAAPELHAERAQLRGDLQQRGYIVLPEREVLVERCRFPRTNRGGFRFRAALRTSDCAHRVDRVESGGTVASTARTRDPCHEGETQATAARPDPARR